MSILRGTFIIPSFLLFCFLILIFPCFPSVAQENEFNSLLMESTFKIQGKGAIGTVFILGIPSKKDPNKGAYVMITAAHVLDSMKSDTAQLVLRKKFLNGSYERKPFPILIKKDGKPLWVHHPDADIDVAAMYVGIPSYDTIPVILTEVLAGDSLLNEFEFHPGDELFCLGYPLNAEGPSGFPVLRSGRIASFPLLPTKTTRGFLFDFRVFPGNSGGPVYSVASIKLIKGNAFVPAPAFIAGLVSQEVRGEEITKSLYTIEKQSYSLGLAMVVPASFIKETIALLPPIE